MGDINFSNACILAANYIQDNCSMKLNCTDTSYISTGINFHAANTATAMISHGIFNPADNKIRYELTRLGSNIKENFPTVYITGDDTNVRISIGDSFRGINKNLVYPTHFSKHNSWEIVIFDGNIADPEFDIEEIARRVNAIIIMRITKVKHFWHFIITFLVPSVFCVISVITGSTDLILCLVSAIYIILFLVYLRTFGFRFRRLFLHS